MSASLLLRVLNEPDHSGEMVGGERGRAWERRRVGGECAQLLRRKVRREGRMEEKTVGVQ